MGGVAYAAPPHTMEETTQPTRTIQPEGASSDSGVQDLSLTNEAVRLITLKTHLGIDATDRDHDSELKGILEWAKESGIKNKNQLLARLKEIQYKLGLSEKKENIKNIYQYIRIDSQIKSLVNKQEMLRK